MAETALAERIETAPATVETLPTSDMAFIERMALNPAIDPEKLERLIAMQKDMAATTAKAAFTAAMVRMRPDLPVIEKKGLSNNGAYGKWEDIQGAVDPVLASHGFALSFKTSSAPNSITVTAILRHEGGHEDSTELTLPADNSGSKNSVQAVGSSVSYGKRYTAGALLNLRIAGDDDDGGKAGGNMPVSDEQRDRLLALASQKGADLVRFCKFFKIEAVADLPASKYDQAIKMIEAKRK
jgi:hypothetical protein